MGLCVKLRVTSVSLNSSALAKETASLLPKQSKKQQKAELQGDLHLQASLFLVVEFVLYE